MQEYHITVVPSMFVLLVELLIDIENKFTLQGRNEEECRLQLVRSTKQSPPPGYGRVG